MKQCTENEANELARKRNSILVNGGWQLSGTQLAAIINDAVASRAVAVEKIERVLSECRNQCKPSRSDYPAACEVSAFHCSYPECSCGR